MIHYYFLSGGINWPYSATPCTHNLSSTRGHDISADLNRALSYIHFPSLLHFVNTVRSIGRHLIKSMVRGGGCTIPNTVQCGV